MRLLRVALRLGIACTLSAFLVDAQSQIPSTLYDQIASEFEEGNLVKAEQTLATALREHPREVRALGLMGVILDAQKRYDQAEEFYRKALELDPDSAPLLNNLGNHYLEKGEPQRARESYLKVIAIHADHPNANLHLAQMSVAAKKGDAALRFLDHMPADSQSEPGVELLRAQALDLAGQRAQAQALVERVEAQANTDPRVLFNAGMVLVNWRRYEDAEKAFTKALSAAPGNLDILYNLGLAAARAGHTERALEILQTALNQRPSDVDCLYNLARVYGERGQDGEAIPLLVRAQQLAPDRPEIAIFTAGEFEKLGFFTDTALAYSHYLKLRPSDDVARRERGFALARGTQIEQGLVDLRWYVQRHPQDVSGLYELGTAETVKERPKALTDLNRAVALDPKLSAARYARAVLLCQDGKPAEAVPDLQWVLKSDPNDYRALDQLGEAYLTLGRASEALEMSSRAAKLAPNEPKVLAHYSRALLRVGRHDEAEKVLARFQKLQSDPLRPRRSAGLFDFLKLTPAEQQARYMENLQRQLAMNPGDPALQARLGKALLAQGKTEDGLAAFRHVRQLTSEPGILYDCGQVLLGYEQFTAAREFLESAVTAEAARADARLDLAMATFHSVGAQEGLAELDKTPPAQRQGDYFLLRAQMLDAMGHFEEAMDDLNRGFRANPIRPGLYLEAALFLIKNNRYRAAIDLLQQARRIVPDAPDLLLTEAIVYELLQQSPQAQEILTAIESRWPEWSFPYLINGIMLETRLKSAQAKPLLETAVALGERDFRAYYYLALATTHTNPDDAIGAQKAIDQALQLNPNDPYVQALAGKLAYGRKDFAAAIEHLTAAVRLWPDMVEAHQTLSGAYRALGEQDKSIAELNEVLRIKKATRSADLEPPSVVRSLLFSVHVPSAGSR